MLTPASGGSHENTLKHLPIPTTQAAGEASDAEYIKRVFSGIKTKIGAHDYAILLLLLDTGIRNAQLCRLTLNDVHIDKDPGWIKVRGKGNKAKFKALKRPYRKAGRNVSSPRRQRELQPDHDRQECPLGV
jgi:integrase